MTERAIHLLVDYKGEFHVRHARTAHTTRLDRLAELFAERGYSLRVRPFDSIDLRSESFDRVPVLYQSSQDPGLHYKSYIEDVLLGLKLKGAWLIPRFEYFRAHHNKVFMELLRDLIDEPAVQTLRSQAFGTFEDFDKRADALEYPLVLKTSGGDSSTGVRLLHNAQDARRIAKQLSRTFDLKDAYENIERSWRKAGIRPASLHRGKFIVQPFIEGLDGDYKVLVMGDRWYVVRRPLKKAGDFRASGVKGALSFVDEIPAGLLDTAARVFRAFRVPYASLDLLPAPDGRFHLGEMQFVRFGTSLVKKSTFYWQPGPNGWTKVDGTTEWEWAVCHAVSDFIETHEAARGP